MSDDARQPRKRGIASLLDEARPAQPVAAPQRVARPTGANIRFYTRTEQIARRAARKEARDALGPDATTAEVFAFIEAKKGT